MPEWGRLGKGQGAKFCFLHKFCLWKWLRIQIAPRGAKRYNTDVNCELQRERCVKYGRDRAAGAVRQLLAPAAKEFETFGRAFPLK